MSHAGPNLVSYPPSGPDRRVVIHLEGPVDELAALVRELLAGRMNPVVPPPGTEAAVVVSAPSLPWDEAIASWRDWATTRGVKPSTLKAYAYMLERIRAGSGWRTIADIRTEHAFAFIASRQRNEHKGRPWTSNTVRQAWHALKSFGEWMASTGRPDPFAGAEPPKKSDAAPRQALTAQQMTRLLAASLRRGRKDKRGNPHAALFWCFMAYTGLRISEAMSVRWGDIVLDADLPGLVVRPDLDGNKGGRRHFIPLHPSLYSLLHDHRARVANGPSCPVFPRPPTDNTFDGDRRLAGLSKVDGMGAILVPHSMRHTLATTLAQSGCPEGLRMAIMRHRSGLTNDVYTHHTRQDMATAVAQMPNFWPEPLPTIPPGGGDTRHDPPPRPPTSPESGKLDRIIPENISTPLQVRPIDGKVSTPSSAVPTYEQTHPSTPGRHDGNLAGQAERVQFAAGPAQDSSPGNENTKSVLPTFPCFSSDPDTLQRVIRVLTAYAEMSLSRNPALGGSDAIRIVPVPHRPPSGFPTI